MLQAASRRFATLTADWVRVGYCQGNFNSDNCLVGGRTMDYGPFGFVEKFQPLWNMWVGGGEHYGFLNQPEAGHRNFQTLVEAVLPVLDGDGAAEQRCRAVIEAHRADVAAAMDSMWSRKLGLAKAGAHPGAGRLATELCGLMEESEADWTLTWRQLAAVAELGAASDDDDDALLAPLRECFYSTPGAASPVAVSGSTTRSRWLQWIRAWRLAVAGQGDAPSAVAASMRLASPKYVPREWMLVEAYRRAEGGDYSLLRDMHELFRHPYAEQPAQEAAYYRKAPEATYAGVGKAGTAFMS